LVNTGGQSGHGSGDCNSVIFNDPIPCFVDLGNDTTLCQGETLTLDATTPGASYLWQDDSTEPTLTVTEEGTYWVEITVGECTARDTILIDYLVPTPIDLGNDTTLCQGETLTLDPATPGSTYLWQDSSTDPTFTVTESGTYWVDVTLSGCLTTDTILVDFISIPIDLGNDTTLCQGEILTLDASTSDASYLWQDNSTEPTFTVSEEGTYAVEITVGECTARDSIEIDYLVPTPIDLGNDTTLCQGETITLDATTPDATYMWQDGSTDSTLAVSNQGTYAVEVTVNGCTAADTILVSLTLLPVIDLGPDTTICQGDTLTLDATTTNGSYLWQDNSTLPTFSVTRAGVYVVQVSVDNCTSVAAVSIDEEDCEVILILPNVFTPNNDGLNDLFVPLESKGIVSMNTVIYNRWGTIIFETDNLMIEWSGEDFSEGTYFWIITYSDVNAEKGNLKGQVTLFK
jgi:gliding motility-associated-like protein